MPRRLCRSWNRGNAFSTLLLVGGKLAVGQGRVVLGRVVTADANDGLREDNGEECECTNKRGGGGGKKEGRPSLTSLRALRWSSLNVDGLSLPMKAAFQLMTP